MIKTLTPYYVTVPLINPNSSVVCNSYTIKLFIWKGNKTAVPSVASYEKTKVNAALSDGDDKINIARLINDFIDFECVPSFITSLEDSNNQVWVKFVCYYDDEPELPQLTFIELAVRGYGYFLEGENPLTPANKILLEGTEFKVNRNGLFVMGIELDETTPPVPSLVIDTLELDGDMTFTTNIDHDGIGCRYLFDDVWFLTPDFILTSPTTITMPVLSGDYEFQLFTFDPLTNEDVYSDSFLITIP